MAERRDGRVRARRWLGLRRTSQILNLALWGMLLFPGLRLMLPAALPPDLYLLLDPLSGLSAALAGRAWWPALALGVLTLGVTGLVGRFFCGWVCPLGALHDLVGWFADRLRKPRRGRASTLAARLTSPRLQLALLLLVLAGLPWGLQLAYLLDPLPLLTRAAALLGLPQSAQPVAPAPPGLAWAGQAALALLLVGLLLSVVVRRLWCRSICPLGGLLALVGRWSPLAFVARGCTECGRCTPACPMGVTDLQQGSQDEACVRCWRCAAVCSGLGLGLRRRADVAPSPASPSPASPVPSDPRRRVALGALTAGTLLGVIHLARPRAALAAPLPPLRPPWAREEAEFLARCVRCGACVRSCPTGTLRSFFFEQGALGLWTPELVPTLGGCLADCTACADSCPTGAIAPFTRQTKYQVRAGLASFDSRRCVAYGPAERPCSHCLTVCPTQAFAIHRCMHTGQAKPRAVMPERCVGCGLCEYVCVVETAGRPALVTSAQGRGGRTRL